jgi:hypothetical protein
MTDRLPELLDARHLAAEIGVTRAAAEAIMRRLPTVHVEDLRKRRSCSRGRAGRRWPTSQPRPG